MRETIEIMQGIWTNDLFEYHGEFADFPLSGFGHKPLQKPGPPIYFSGLKDATWQLAVPVLAQQVVLSRIVRGDALGAADWLLPCAIALAIAAVCVAGVVRLLREERIVFGRT